VLVRRSGDLPPAADSTRHVCGVYLALSVLLDSRPGRGDRVRVCGFLGQHAYWRVLIRSRGCLGHNRPHTAVFRRTYNSTDFRQTPLGPVGLTISTCGSTDRGQTHLTSSLSARRGGAIPSRGTPTAAGPTSPGQTCPFSHLSHRSTGEYVASEEDGSVWTFDGQGRLTEVAEPSKPTLTVVQGQYVRSAWRSFPATPLTDFVEA
jgi:hypothetical protein